MPRTSFIATLESMKQRNLIDYSQNEIRIISRPEMIGLLTSQAES